MLRKLPELIEPVVFAERQSHLVSSLALTRLKRLTDLFDNQTGHLDVDLQFYKEGAVPKIEGYIKGELQLVCQNCLEAVSWRLNKSIKIGMVRTMEQADRLENDLEPLLVTGEKISLPELIEDEVLMALPDYPRHIEDCRHFKAPKPFIESEKITEKPANPFAVLAQLKNSGDH